MKVLAKIILGVSLLGGLSQFAEAGEKKKLTISVEGGMVSGATTVGASVHRGKYTVDAHVGVGSETKKVISVGIYRDIVKLGDLSIGAGLSANKVTEKLNKVRSIRTYQGYDANVSYDFGKYKVRGTINSNGDVKAGIGFSF